MIVGAALCLANLFILMTIGKLGSFGIHYTEFLIVLADLLDPIIPVADVCVRAGEQASCYLQRFFLAMNIAVFIVLFLLEGGLVLGSRNYRSWLGASEHRERSYNRFMFPRMRMTLAYDIRARAILVIAGLISIYYWPRIFTSEDLERLFQFRRLHWKEFGIYFQIVICSGVPSLFWGTVCLALRTPAQSSNPDGERARD